MTPTYKLNYRETVYIDEQMKELAAIVRCAATIRESRKFNVGDYLIIRWFDEDGQYKGTLYNSYGAPQKFVVVHKDSDGNAYAVKIKNKNRHSKYLLCVGRVLDGKNWDAKHHCWHWGKFEIDPDYVDAVLLEETCKYDPCANSCNRAQIYRDIIEHNKLVKVSTKTLLDVMAFIRKIKVGDTFWTSNKKSYLVTGKEKCSAITTTCNSGQTKKIRVVDLKAKAIYVSRPRSYDELKNL